MTEKMRLAGLCIFGQAKKSRLAEAKAPAAGKIATCRLKRWLVGVYSIVLGSPKWKSRLVHNYAKLD
jgi:hypothetical protein